MKALGFQVYGAYVRCPCGSPKNVHPTRDGLRSVFEEQDIKLNKTLVHMSHSLNSLKGGSLGDYTGEYVRSY